MACECRELEQLRSMLTSLLLMLSQKVVLETALDPITTVIHLTPAVSTIAAVRMATAGVVGFWRQHAPYQDRQQASKP